MSKRPLSSRCHAHRSERGVVSLLFALLLPVLLGLGALAVDYPYLLSVRGELQNAADAAAIAAGKYLDQNGTPNWSETIKAGQSALAFNLAGQQAITQADIQVGYWDTSTNRLGLQPLPMSPTQTDVPAVQVSIARSTNQNKGEVNTVFSHFLGIASLPISVTAVAARSGPSVMGAHVLFPLAMPQCMYDTYWDSTSNPPGPRLNPDDKNKVFKFKIGTKSDLGCDINGIKFPAGAWATLSSSESNSTNLQNFVGTRLAQSLAIGDQIWVNSGNFSANLYKAVNDCSAAAPQVRQSCRYVTIPVFENKAETGFNQISGFACIEILNAQNGSQKYVEVSMSTLCPTPPSSGIGPSYGVKGPPKLFL